MALDPRQLVAGFLTFTMFVMVGNMIKRDHFDSFEISPVNIPDLSGVQFDMVKIEEQKITTFSKVSGQLKQSNLETRPCWTKPASKEVEKSKGFVTFSLTIGPEYHISQIADAVVIARHLGATLVLPDIRGKELGQKRNFQDVYDLEKFVKSLDGVIQIAGELPAEVAAIKPAIVRVPKRVTKEFIASTIEPTFRKNSYLRLAIVFPSISVTLREKQNEDLDSTACLAMFGSLETKGEIQDVADRMIKRLKALSHRSDGQFVAVDLRVDILKKKSCKLNGVTRRKSCYNAQEVADFLRKVGFDGDTTVYLTQTRWHESLNPLKEAFPKTYTKDDIIPANEKGRFLKSASDELERFLDFDICSKSDVFVPAIPGLFYGNVAGRRIASGLTQILVPSQVFGSSAPAAEFISTYVSKRTHMAYSCYC